MAMTLATGMQTASHSRAAIAQFFLIRQSFVVPIVCFSNQSKFTRITKSSKSITLRISEMRLTNRIKQAGATGYILLWLLGIPIPILLLIFLLRGCT